MNEEYNLKWKGCLFEDRATMLMPRTAETTNDYCRSIVNSTKIQLWERGGVLSIIIASIIITFHVNIQIKR